MTPRKLADQLQKHDDEPVMLRLSVTSSVDDEQDSPLTV
jgi:hypothetical protein